MFAVIDLGHKVLRVEEIQVRLLQTSGLTRSGHLTPENPHSDRVPVWMQNFHHDTRVAYGFKLQPLHWTTRSMKIVFR
jgi:hypothetical protein